METEKLREIIKEEISQLEGDMLQLASMFIYNWTEGPWTPAPLTSDQIAELERRIEEVESGETELISMDEVLEEFREKHGLVREEGEQFRIQKNEKERGDLVEMLNHVSRAHLHRLNSFLESYKEVTKWEGLDERTKESIQRGMSQAKAGKLTDAFEFLKNHG